MMRIVFGNEINQYDIYLKDKSEVQHLAGKLMECKGIEEIVIYDTRNGNRLFKTRRKGNSDDWEFEPNDSTAYWRLTIDKIMSVDFSHLDDRNKFYLSIGVHV